MAKLIDSPKEWQQRKDEKFDAYLNRMDKVVDEIDEEDNLLRFPIADGYAMYEIVKEKPLTIRHIPCGDDWHIPDAHVKGLTMIEVKQQRRWRALWRKQI